MDPYYLYIDRDSIFHRLDPRTKMLLLLVTFVLVFISLNPLYLLAILLLVLLAGYVAGVLVNLRRIRFVLFMITLVTIVLWSLFQQGTTPLFWIIERESVVYAVSVAIRIDTMVIAGLIFLSITRNEDIAMALVRIGIPYRFAFVVSTALRLVPTIASTTTTITQAQRSRGLDLDTGGPIQRIKNYIPLLIPVFISTIRSTNIFSMALESKGFGAMPSRTYYLQLKMVGRDFVVIFIALGLLVFIISARILGYL